MMTQYHGRMSARHRGRERCAICRRVRPVSKKIGLKFYCEECWRREVK